MTYFQKNFELKAYHWRRRKPWCFFIQQSAGIHYLKVVFTD